MTDSPWAAVAAVLERQIVLVHRRAARRRRPLPRAAAAIAPLPEPRVGEMRRARVRQDARDPVIAEPRGPREHGDIAAPEPDGGRRLIARLTWGSIRVMGGAENK